MLCASRTTLGYIYCKLCRHFKCPDIRLFCSHTCLWITCVEKYTVSIFECLCKRQFNPSHPRRFGKWECSATRSLIANSCDMWHPLFPDQTISDFPTSITFTKNAYSQRNTRRIQIVCTVPPNNCVFMEKFLFVLKKRHLRFRSLFLHIKSQRRSTLHI